MCLSHDPATDRNPSLIVLLQFAPYIMCTKSSLTMSLLNYSSMLSVEQVKKEKKTPSSLSLSLSLSLFHALSFCCLFFGLMSLYSCTRR